VSTIIWNLKRVVVAGLTLVALGGTAFAQPTTQTPVRPTATHNATALPGSAGMSCAGDKVVWVNTKSGIYHFQGERWFGKTKAGKYMCERVADAEGDRPTHNGQ